MNCFVLWRSLVGILAACRLPLRRCAKIDLQDRNLFVTKIRDVLKQDDSERHCDDVPAGTYRIGMRGADVLKLHEHTKQVKWKSGDHRNGRREYPKPVQLRQNFFPLANSERADAGHTAELRLQRVPRAELAAAEPGMG